MKTIKNKDLNDRRGNANEAKAAQLQAYRAALAAAAPDREARQAERIAIAEAREARRAERERVKLEEQNRIAAEAAEREAAIEAAARAEAEEREAANKARIARVFEDEAARKAERDRRYANRKARRPVDGPRGTDSCRGSSGGPSRHDHVKTNGIACRRTSGRRDRQAIPTAGNAALFSKGQNGPKR